MNKLVEEIIKPILEANSDIKKVVGIFGGRFQPFGPHHKKVYEWLDKQFDDAYITTSNIKQLPRHPMNFKEKVRHMKKMGIPANKIVQEKSPFVAKNLAKKFNSKTTAFVYIFGAKDTGRLGGGKYFQDYKKNKNNLKGHEEHGYYLVAPHMSVSAGGLEVSGTAMRELLGSDKFDDKERTKLFKKMFGYYDKGIFNMMTNKFKKIFEFHVSEPKKPLKKKWKDGEGKELIQGWLEEDWFKKGSKKDRALKLKISKLYSKAFKMVANSKEQLKVRKEIEKLRNQLSEGVDLPIEIGDTVRMGKFKNKKVVVKSIDWNEKGDLLINGRPALKFRITKNDIDEKVDYKKALKKLKIPTHMTNNKQKLVNYLTSNPQILTQLLRLIGEDTIGSGYPNKKDMKKIRKRVKKARSKSNSNKEYQYHPIEIEEFLTTVNMSKIVKEVTHTAKSGKGVVDDGPSAFMYGKSGYFDRNKEWAEKLGWGVMNYILDVDVSKIPPYKDEFGGGKAVTPLPAGIGTGTTPNNPENLTGIKGYNKWVKNMRNIAQTVGMELLKFRQQKEDEKEQKKSVAKDSRETLKQQKKDEKEKENIKVEENVFSKDWWGDLITEDWWSDMSSQEQEDYIKKHPASQKARQRKDKEEKKKRKSKVKNLPGIDKPIDKNSPKAKGAQTKGPKTDDDAIGTDAEKERVIIRGIQQLVHSGHDVDLCKISVPGTNLFCDANKGIPRKEMPQFKSKPMEGSKAEELVNKGILKVDKNGEVDTEDIFLKHIGKKAKPKRVKVTSLKATQNQIVGNKVSLFLNQLQNGDEDSEFTKALKEPIIVSSDGYIIDGHHRWAALVALDIANGGDGDIEMDIKEVDEPVESLLKKSNDFTNQMGLETKSGGKEKKEESITEVSAKTKLFKQKLMRRGIKIRYDKAKAEKDLAQKYGGQGEVVGKKFGLRKAYYAVPKKGFKKDTKPTITINKKEMDKLHTDKKIEKGNLRVLYKESLLLEGGAYGHMAHPFDDKDLTFGDLKQIIEDGLGGNLSREDNVTEKLDGQNIMISWKDGKLIAARNKGHIKNGGKTALDKKGIASKFKGRGDIKNAFVFAMNDLEKAIKSLSDKQKEKIFNNGHNFMNMEVMWPASANVIDYDKAELVFHGAIKYDDSGTPKGEVKGSGRILAGMIEQRNQNIQKKYKIGKPVFLEVPKHQDFGTMKSKFIGELNKLRNQYALKDTDTLALYHQSYWEEYIYNAAQQFGYTISNTILENLTKRWAFFDKSYKIPTIRTDLKDQPKFLEWVLKTDKEDHKAMVKENMKPFETLFFGVGAEILKNVKGFMAANPNKAVQGVRKRLNTSIENVKASGDKKKLNTLKLQLDKLNKIGGVDSIVPSEGIVFKYKGKTYKFTGAFAPINQITGLINF